MTYSVCNIKFISLGEIIDEIVECIDKIYSFEFGEKDFIYYHKLLKQFIGVLVYVDDECNYDDTKHWYHVVKEIDKNDWDKVLSEYKKILQKKKAGK